MDLLQGIDVAGMRCLDVGAAHGVISLGLALRGAAVTAIDIGGPKPPQIVLAEEILGVQIDYQSPISVEDAPRRFAPASFDLIVCAGVMYHLLSPADVFTRLRPILKRNGLLVMESACLANQKEPVLVLNTETGTYSEPTTYFLPSANAIPGLAKLACFDVVATRFNLPGRYALLGRAVPPAEVRNRSEQCRKVHGFGISDPSFSLAGFATAEQSSIRYSVQQGHAVLDLQTYRPEFPPNPKEIRTPLGKSVTVDQLKAALAKSL
jgi:SAM-dependent methyltransferase